MTDANALTPCPFCGERAETDFIPEHHSYQIECSDVFGCTARVTRDSEQAAIKAWNLRAPAPAASEALITIESSLRFRLACAKDDAAQLEIENRKLRERVSQLKAAPASQPVAAPVGPFPVASKSHGAWDGIEDVLAMPDGTDIYTASQVQAMLAAVPRNAPLYSPDDVAFPVQRSADGTDALPPELASIAAAEVAAPIAPGE